ncbi:regulator of G-protein signaling 3-like [Limulus polyphemus]|uniref:Regulator of G-protein signaling 3-like n=1 Tax=Limulus polyphemus TaxID=6850 RepID=A0ABM1BFW5_LIMPO|nr:regulator of G-protein signaling 3-like [Limulus polyphemus]XP_022249128.1 regulator of G-protein signaling 3-like [Limulus polyphemus]
MDRSQCEFDDELLPFDVIQRENYDPMRRIPEKLTQKDGGTRIMESGENAWEESSSSWASSSAGETPSYGSTSLAFEFEQKCNMAEPITNECCQTVSERPSTSDCQKDEEMVRCESLSSDQLAEVDSQESGSDTTNDWVCGVRTKVRKGSGDNCKLPGGAAMAASISKGTEKISRLLRRTHSAGCSKDVPAHALFLREELHVTEAKSADSSSAMTCELEEGEDRKKHRKSLAQDMKLRLGFLRRRHTDSSIQATIRPSPEEAGKWAESFNELMASKYGSSLFKAFLSREFSEENIEFWLACEEFKKTRSNKLPSKARKIYSDFVAVQAPKEVNLDSTTRMAVMNSLSNPDHHSFDQAQRKVQGLMERDAYHRFLQSEFYLELLQGSR